MDLTGMNRILHFGTAPFYPQTTSRNYSPVMNKRRATRLRTLKGGSIIFGLAAEVDCIIRNMSETGAALEVESPIGIPDDFTLLIKPELTKRRCKVAWRSSKRLGVEFV